MAHNYKDGDLVEVPGYGSGVVYDVGQDTNAHCVRVKLDREEGGSVRVDVRNLTKAGKAAHAGTQPPSDTRDKAMRGPRE